MRRVHLVACLLLAAAGGCAYQTTTPLPKTLPSAGILVRCTHERLNLYYQMREYELLTSDVSNDLYPFNIVSAQPSGKLVPRLYAWRAVWWEEIDFAELPPEKRARKARISIWSCLPKNRRIWVTDSDGSRISSPRNLWRCITN